MTEENETEFTVYRDRNDNRRAEIWTDGQTIKVGVDVEDDRCLEFLYENGREFIGEFRSVSGSEKISPDAVGYGPNTYVVGDFGFSDFVVYDKSGVVLKIDDHECGILYRAVNMAEDIRQESFDYADVARSWTESVVPDTADIEVKSNTSPTVLVCAGIEGGRIIRDDLIRSFKENEMTEYDKTYINSKDGNVYVEYWFRLDTDAVGGDADE